MFSFYLVNLGIRPCLNSLGCVSGEFQMCGMLQLDIFVWVLETQPYLGNTNGPVFVFKTCLG